MTAVIKAEGIVKHYADCVALDGVSFSVQQGQILGLIGPNGAGKTSLLRSLVGLTSCQGQLEVLGLNPLAQRRQLMERLMFIADVATLPRWLKVYQAIDFVQRVHVGFQRDKFDHFFAKTRIKLRQSIKNLSKGMIAQLHLALIMAIDAQVLVLDEPTTGLDLVYRHEFYQSLLNDYYTQDRTIIISTHQVEEVEAILTDVMMLHEGKVLLHDSMDAFSNRYCRLLVSPDKIIDANKHDPIARSDRFGQKQFIYEDTNPDTLAHFGKIEAVSVRDVFLAKVTGEKV